MPRRPLVAPPAALRARGSSPASPSVASLPPSSSCRLWNVLRRCRPVAGAALLSLYAPRLASGRLSRLHNVCPSLNPHNTNKQAEKFPLRHLNRAGSLRSPAPLRPAPPCGRAGLPCLPRPARVFAPLRVAPRWRRVRLRSPVPLLVGACLVSLCEPARFRFPNLCSDA